MELTYLQEFTTFSQYMNVSEAARHLYLSKSALSKHLSTLEHEFGVQLFVRDKTLRLTPAGRLLAQYGEEVLLAYNRARDLVSAAPLDAASGYGLGFGGYDMLEEAS